MALSSIQPEFGVAVRSSVDYTILTVFKEKKNPTIDTEIMVMLSCGRHSGCTCLNVLPLTSTGGATLSKVAWNGFRFLASTKNSKK